MDELIKELLDLLKAEREENKRLVDIILKSNNITDKEFIVSSPGHMQSLPSSKSQRWDIMKSKLEKRFSKGLDDSKTEDLIKEAEKEIENAS